MRRYDIVSGILFILSIIVFALAAPVSMQQERQAGVDVVRMPKDAITVLGTRGDEELEKLAEQYLKTWGKPIDSSDSHASSSSAPPNSAPPGPEHVSTNVVQAPEPGPASSTANPGPLMGPSSPSSIEANPDLDSFQNRFDEAWNRKYSDKDSDTSKETIFTPGTSQFGSDEEPEWATGKVSSLPLAPGADPNFDWHFWSTKPSPPKYIGLAPEHQMGHSGQQSDAGPSTVPGPDFEGPDPNFDWAKWMSDPESPKGIGLAPEHQMVHGQQPNPGPSTDPDPNFEGPDPNFDWAKWMSDQESPTKSKEYGLPSEHQVGNPWVLPSTGPNPDFDWHSWTSLNDPLTRMPSLRPGSMKETDPNRWGIPGSELTTKPLDSSPNLNEAQQPPPFPMPSTELDKDHDLNTPLPYPSTTDFYSYRYPGSVMQPPSQDPWLPTVPEHEVSTQPSTPGAESPTEFEHEEEVGPPSPNLGSPKEPEDEVVPGPPPSPNPEYSSDHQSSSADSQPVNLQTAINYVLKSKGKQPVERSLDG